MPVINMGTLAKYRVFRNGESATIALGGWSNPEVAGYPKSFGGEILIHSSLGHFNYCWSACAKPFKEFLLSISMDSFMLKTIGDRFQVFDGDTSLRQLKDGILRARRANRISGDAARDAWGNVAYGASDAVRDKNAFWHLVSELNHLALNDAEAFLSYKPNPHAQLFWDTLWADFTTELKRELSQATPHATVTELEEDI